MDVCVCVCVLVCLCMYIYQHGSPHTYTHAPTFVLSIGPATNLTPATSTSLHRQRHTHKYFLIASPPKSTHTQREMIYIDGLTLLEAHQAMTSAISVKKRKHAIMMIPCAPTAASPIFSTSVCVVWLCCGVYVCIYISGEEEEDGSEGGELGKGGKGVGDGWGGGNGHHQGQKAQKSKSTGKPAHGDSSQQGRRVVRIVVALRSGLWCVGFGCLGTRTR